MAEMKADKKYSIYDRFCLKFVSGLDCLTEHIANVLAIIIDKTETWYDRHEYAVKTFFFGSLIAWGLAGIIFVCATLFGAFFGYKIDSDVFFYVNTGVVLQILDLFVVICAIFYDRVLYLESLRRK